jgi:two-component system, OmpR family, response regulator
MLCPDSPGILIGLDGAPPTMAKVLLAEDDLELCTVIRDWLHFQRFTVECVHTGTEALEKLKFFEFDLVILDWQMPGMSGLEVCRLYRDKGGTAAVMILTGKQTSVQDKTEGLDSGADDYLCKPFHLHELAARIRALLRRASDPRPATLKAGDIELDADSYRVTRAGTELLLLPREFALLEFLMRHPGTVFSADELLARVWQSDTEASHDALRTCLKRLRKKIDSPGRDSIIRTIHGIGYKLSA